MAEIVSFGQPWGLVLLLALPGLVLVGRRRLAALGRGRALASQITRVTLFSLLVLALADPRLLLPDRHVSVVFALDRSSSIPASQGAAAAAWIAQAEQAANADDASAVLAFGQQPILQQFARSTPPRVDDSATDLAATLHLAGELASRGAGQPRVVVLSDGWETSGHALDQVAWLTAHGVSVSYVPLLSNEGPAVALQRLDAPALVREGETADLRVSLASTAATRAVLTLSEDGQPRLQHAVQLPPGDSSVTLRYTADTLGTHVLSADLSTDRDVQPRSMHADAVLVAKPRPKVLLVESQATQGDALAAALEAGSIDVDRRDQGAIPVKAMDLAAYEAVVLDDVQATTLSLDQQLTLQSYVRDMGHGLLAVGGQNSYSMGAYADTELEKLLPVRATPPDRNQQGDLALLLVIDTSGSMSLATNHVVKMEMAKQAAMQAVAVLKPTDTVGVLVFNTRYQWVVPPQIVADNGGLPDIQSRISTIKAVGGTDIYAALDAAYQSMSQLDVRFRHMLLLTDGQSPNPNYQTLVSRNQVLGVTLSTVAIGQDADTGLLSQLAQLGAGRSYATQRFDDIPSIVAKETAIASRSSLAEGQFEPLPLDPSPLLSGQDTASLPKLGGYVQTTARPGATIALASPRQDPILSHWHFGLGRVVAWTSDAGNLWATDWFAGPAAGLFAQALRWTMTAPVDPRLTVSAQVSRNAMTLTADSLEPDGSFGDGLDTRATVVTPAATATEIRLPQVAPGRYQRTFEVPQTGVYHVLVHQGEASGDVLEEVLGSVVDGNAEERSVGTNEPLLTTLAAQTGGRKLVAPEDVFVRDSSFNGHAWQPIWPWLLVAALLLFPVDVAMRRLQVSAPRWPTAHWPRFVRDRAAR